MLYSCQSPVIILEITLTHNKYIGSSKIIEINHSMVWITL